MIGINPKTGFILLVPVLILAAVLRLHNVGENPYWYTDEATHIDIAQHLKQGEIRYMAVQDSTLLFARPPLFHLVLAGYLIPDHDPMLTLRRLTASLGVATVLILYMAISWQGDVKLALLAALMLAVYPQAVLYNRMGFSYNLVAPLLMFVVWGLSAFVRTKTRGWLVLAALATGLGTITDITMANVILPLVLIVILVAKRPLDLVWSLPLALLPFGVYALVMLFHAPDAFLFDLRFTLSRLNPHPEIEWQINNLIHNYRVLLAQSWWFPAALIGLLTLKQNRAVIWVLFLLPLVNVGRIVALYSLSAYYLIPLLPFVALGVAALLRYGVGYLWESPHPVVPLPKERRIPILFFRRTLAFAVTGLTVVLLLSSFADTLNDVQTRFIPDTEPFLTNPWAAREVAVYINAHSNPDDVAVVTPVLGWMLNLNVVDYQMIAASVGVATPHLPANIPPERFAFDPSYQSARYVVVDPTWVNWGAVHVPGVESMLCEIESWQLIFESGELKVYENPSFEGF